MGIGNLEVLAGANLEPETLQSAFNDVGASDQYGLRNLFFHQDLCRPQDPFVFAFGKDDPFFQRCFGRSKERFHDQAGAEDKTVERIKIGVIVADWSGGDAGVGCGLRHGGSDAQNETRIKG